MENNIEEQKFRCKFNTFLFLSNNWVRDMFEGFFFFFVLRINILLSKFNFFVLHINILISGFVFECGGLFFKGGDICPLASYIEIISLVSKVLKQFKESNISSPRGSSLVTKLGPQRLEFSLLTWRFLPLGIRVSKTQVP